MIISLSLSRSPSLPFLSHFHASVLILYTSEEDLVKKEMYGMSFMMYSCWGGYKRSAIMFAFAII